MSCLISLEIFITKITAMTFCFCSFNAMAIALFSSARTWQKASYLPSSKITNRHVTPIASISCEAEGCVGARESRHRHKEEQRSAHTKDTNTRTLQRYPTRSSTRRERRARWCQTSECCADLARALSTVTPTKLAAAVWNTYTWWREVWIINKGANVHRY